MKKTIITLSAVGLFSLGYYLFHKNGKVEPYWGKTIDRSPASALDQFKPELKIYQEMFSYSTDQKKISYDLDVKLRTDADDEYLKRKADLALHDAFRLSFDKINSEKEKDPSLISVFKTGLIESFVDHFIKTIGALKLVNKTFQIDFSFIPNIQKDLNYKEELSSNQLIQWDDIGSLYQELQSKELPLQEKILNTKLPATEKLFQYQGGQISLWIKILDMSPSFNIPNPKKNAVKGFVRIRRYYKANGLAELSPFLRNSEFKIDKLGLDFEKEKKDFFITVDLFKEFSLGDIIPKLDRIEIYFGTLLPDNMYKNNIIGKLISNEDHAIKTAELKIKGSFKSQEGSSHPFQSSIQRLTYDFEKKSFDFGDSRIRSVITGNSESPESNLNLQFHQALLKRFAPELIKGLYLQEFHDDIVGGAQ